MPVLQRDLERLVANTHAIDALAADALDRLAALKQAQAELEIAWKDINIHPDMCHISGYRKMQQAIQKVLAV